MKRFMLLFFVILTPAFMLHAQEEGEEGTASMEDVIITATKTEQPVLDVPQHVTVITAEEIEESGVRDVADILQRQAGVSIKDYGPLGALQSVTIRGSKSEQVLVLIDGVRMNSARDNVVDLSLVTLNDIERIEIVRGGTSALYGANAVGGVINIITKKEADDKLKIRIQNGSYIPQSYVTGTGVDEEEHGAEASDLVDAQKVGVVFSKAFGTTHFTTSGSVYTSDNDYVYKDENGDRRKRENAEIIGGDLTAALKLPLGNGNLDVKGQIISNKKGAPGSVTYPSPRAEQKDVRAQGSVGYFTDTFISDVLTLNLNSFFNYSNLQFEDPDYFLGPLESEHKLYSTGVDLSQEMLAFSYFSIVYGGNISYDWAESTDIGKQDRVYTGIFVETPLYITGTFTLIPMVRYDYYSDFKGALNYKLAVNQTLSSKTSLKGSISKSFRPPTLNELYWPFDGMMEGNPDLGPETGYAVDLGITRVGERTRYNFFLFTRYVRDIIIWEMGSDFISRSENYGEGLYPGFEADFGMNITAALLVYARYTFLYTFALGGEYTVSDDNRFPHVPVHEADFGIDYCRRTFSVGLNGHLESKRYESVDNTDYLPSYFVVDAYYRQNIGKATVFLLSVDNVFNKQYEVVPGYPMPGLFIRTGFEFEF